MQSNQISRYICNLFSNELDKFNTDLQREFYNTLLDGCIYIPHFACKKGDRTIYNNLMDEIKSLENSDEHMVNWSKHHKFENPDFLPTFTKVVEFLSTQFNVQISQTRLNFYTDQNDFKPFHHDRHAYGDKLEDFTIGASFGYSRDLVFLHEPTNKQIRFPQNNGDVFAFDKKVNKMFMHGVPKSSRKVGPRFSIIVWGRKNA